MGSQLLERWAAIEPLLDRALDEFPDQRAAFLARACADDPTLSNDLERLLRAGEAPGDPP